MNEAERRAHHAKMMEAYREKTSHTPVEFFALNPWMVHTSWCTVYDAAHCNCGLEAHKDRMHAWFRAQGDKP